jgi:hypothetical protein
LELKDLPVIPGRREPKVLKELRARKECRVLVTHKLKVSKVRRELRELRALKEPPALKV